MLTSRVFSHCPWVWEGCIDAWEKVLFAQRVFATINIDYEPVCVSYQCIGLVGSTKITASNIKTWLMLWIALIGK